MSAMVAWWTEADQAELDVVAWELTAAIRDHRRDCLSCWIGSSSCPSVRAAVEAVVEWVRVRSLRSRAVYLRSGQELMDFAARMGVDGDELAAMQRRWQGDDAAAAGGEARLAA
jgi:hypothetical protein